MNVSKLVISLYDTMIRTTALALGVVFAAISPVSAEPAGTAAQVVPCSPPHIALRSDTEDGNFDGVSQSGTLLVFRNISTSACSLEPFVPIVVEKKNGEALNVLVERKTAFTGPIVNGRPLPMGHGPVVLPVIVPPGARATAQLHWVSGSVFDRSVCVDASHLSVDIGGVATQTSIEARMCGPDAKHISVSATQFALDSADGS